MNEYEIDAVARTDLGKGATRRLRRTGMVPAIVYGEGSEPLPVTLNGNTLKRQLENEAFTSHILQMKLGRKAERVVLKDLQRHPVTTLVTHADLLRVSDKNELRMQVPLHFINEEEAPGRKAGGVFSHLMNELDIKCLPKDLPEYIEVDVSGLEMDSSIPMSEVALPEGVSHYNDVTSDEYEDRPVVNIHSPVQHDVDEPEEGEEEEDEETSEDEETD